MQPQHRTLHIKQPRMQPIPIPQINRRHANPTSTLIALVVLLDSLAPELAHLRGTVTAEADVDEEVAVVETRLEYWSGVLGCELVDGWGEEVWGVPAGELAGWFGFKVH